LQEVRPRYVQLGRGAGCALFLSRRGRPLAPESIRDIPKRHGRAAGLGPVSCHTLRRTVATAMLRAGADVRTVAELLGHEDLRTTERYTRVVIEDLRAVHAKTHPRGDGARAR
jgi:site-specific recombinase XerD